jgi:peptidoglycan-associated lipoprotein
MKRGLTSFVSVIMALLCVLAFSACAKKNVPAKQEFSGGAGYGSGEAGAGGQGSGGGMGLSESQWRELGLNTPAERQEFLQKAQSFENEDIHFAYNSYVLTDDGRKILDAKA